MDPARERSTASSPAGAGWTLLRVEGRDALAVLHRISTQSLEGLGDGDARWTLFCDFRGRLLHRAAVAVAGGAVWLLRDDAPGAPLAAWVDRHVFREDVRVADLGGSWRVHGVEDDGGASGVPLVTDGVPRIVRPSPGVALGVAPWTPGAAAANADAIERAREAERGRIEAGRPRHGHEIADAFTPYEVGLASDVHLSKGCYTGQEALLRLVTYDSVRRGLVRLDGEGPAPATPADAARAGEAAGRVTSAVAIAGGWRALAVLRREVLEGPPPEVAGAGPVRAVHAFPPGRPLGLP
jgi:hypothetical protein